ncbi:hypothetical protein GOBAR_AA27932 [Gossypium barbadense]|uniref:THH1/TOM1/TOM3 domain-containing protein n=1 Tax=Gossypium barbadense TaxID=3634 RepID=A0A2P5WNS4_GOSBA|nr:hypothetical protein GOBAR_AA27932 [Gossypium barbadense]
MESYSVDVAAIAYKLKDTANWWRDIKGSRLWQDRIFHILAALYGLVAAVALVQLIRIQMRVPEYGWTTQKVFHFLNFLIVQHILLDMPSLAFFTTYALLILFWAEIYYQARAVSTDGLRPSFFTINAVVYTIQVRRVYIAFADFRRCFTVCGTWLFTVWWKSGFFPVITKPGRIKRFPVESKGRRKKLQEMCFNAFDKGADLNVLNHPILNLIYYLRLYPGSNRPPSPNFYPHCNLVLELKGGDITFILSPFHFEEVATKTRYYPVSSYTLND